MCFMSLLLLCLCAAARADYADYIAPAPSALRFATDAFIPPNTDFMDMVDAVHVEVKTWKAPGSETQANVFLRIGDIDFHLEGMNQAFDRNGIARFTFLLDRPGEHNKLTHPYYPYGYFKFSNMTIRHDTQGVQPGWYLEYIKIYLHFSREGWDWNYPLNGWYRYTSDVPFFRERDFWQAEYDTPYLNSAALNLQYTGRNAGGNKWLALAYRTCAGCDLSGMDLSGADLSGGDFRRADFTGSNLSEAVLHGARLEGARFAAADLSHVNLEEQDLHESDFTAAKLNGANLSGANLRAADFSRADVFESDFQGALLKDATLNNANFQHCNFRGANMQNVIADSFRSHELGRARIVYSNLQMANLRHAALKGCVLDGSDFTGADMTGAGVDKGIWYKNIVTDHSTVCPHEKPGPCVW